MKYKITYQNLPIDYKELEKTLNQESKNGWEIVTTTNMGSELMVVYFNMNFATL